MRKQKGFTLVELLITIVLMGVVAGIVIFNVTNLSKKNRDDEYKQFISTVISSASTYADLNQDAFNDLYVNKAFIYISAGKLIDAGILDKNVVNPYTNEKIKADEMVKASLDTSNDSIVFEYPVESKTEESFLVAMDDSIIWGEPYNCMESSDSYKLSISDEDGNLYYLSDLDDKGNLLYDKDRHQLTYNVSDGKYYYTADDGSLIESNPLVRDFKCKYPDNFIDNDENHVGDPGTKYTEDGGVYDIEYTWVTESGTKKKASRKLKVQNKIIPEFLLEEAFTDGSAKKTLALDAYTEKYYVPTYSNGMWKKLQITPVMESDVNSYREYFVTKLDNTNPNATEVNLTDTFTNETKTFTVDDGTKTYGLRMIVYGVHNKAYKYEAEKENGYKINQELVVEPKFVNSDLDSVPSENYNNSWKLEREYNVQTNNLYSPVGIDYYEYGFGKSDKNDDVSEYTFNVLDDNSKKVITVLGNSPVCGNKYEYNKLNVRAINKDGYAGAWTTVDAYLTNDLYTLTYSDGTNGTSANSCKSGCQINGSECYYCTKQKYLNIKNENAVSPAKRFVVLSSNKDKNGSLVTLTTDGTYGNLFSAIDVSVQTWTIKTCDGTYSTRYTQHTASASKFQPVMSAFLTDLAKEKYFYKNNLQMVNSTTGEVTTLSVDMVNKYKDAVAETNSYWTNTTYGYGKEVRVSHGDHTTKYQSYYYVASFTPLGNGFNTIRLNKDYNANERYFKPIIRVRNIYITSGDGSKENPYQYCYKQI